MQVITDGNMSFFVSILDVLFDLNNVKVIENACLLLYILYLYQHLYHIYQTEMEKF